MRAPKKRKVERLRARASPAPSRPPPRPAEGAIESASSSTPALAMDKRGPKIGDAASLWNFTPSPGWTKEESLILKLCLMKFGVGQWVQIQATGLLPGKLIQQLYGATQRLLGQQSLAAFSGLRVDIDRVRADNEAKADATRKNGLVIWAGPNPTKEMKLQWQQEAREKYGLSPQQQAEADSALEEQAAAVQVVPQAQAACEVLPPGIDLLECDVQLLSTRQQQLLLCTLHQRLAALAAGAVQQQPSLAHLLTYQQQPAAGWIAQGLPAAAGDGGQGASDGRPFGAHLPVRQGGRPGKGSKGSGASKAGGAAGKGSSRAGAGAAAAGGGKQGGGKKRRRHGAAGSAFGDVDADDAADDAEAAFLARQQRRRCTGGGGAGGRRGGGGGAGAGEGGGLLSELMQVALDAGVAQLVDMGYSRSKALDALRECSCDVELAVEFLTAACC